MAVASLSTVCAVLLSPWLAVLGFATGVLPGQPLAVVVRALAGPETVSVGTTWTVLVWAWVAFLLPILLMAALGTADRDAPGEGAGLTVVTGPVLTTYLLATVVMAAAIPLSPAVTSAGVRPAALPLVPDDPVPASEIEALEYGCSTAGTASLRLTVHVRTGEGDVVDIGESDTSLPMTDLQLALLDPDGLRRWAADHGIEVGFPDRERCEELALQLLDHRGRNQLAGIVDDVQLPGDRLAARPDAAPEAVSTR